MPRARLPMNAGELWRNWAWPGRTEGARRSRAAAASVLPRRIEATLAAAPCVRQRQAGDAAGRRCSAAVSVGAVTVEKA